MIKPKLTEHVFEKKQTSARKPPKKTKDDVIDQYKESRQEKMLSSLSPTLNVMIKAVQKAGRGLMRDFGEIEHLQIAKKGLGDFVTNADTFSEKNLREYLQEVRPKYGFLQEEGGEIKGSDTSHRWIIDPLDGTMNFLHGIGHFCISLALQEDKEIIAGVVYNPVTAELYYAEKGSGAFALLGGSHRRLRVSNRTSLEEAVIGVGSMLYRKQNDPKMFDIREKILDTAVNSRCMGSAALDLAYVAAGKMDAFLEPNLKPWDIAAGLLLVKEAGGHIATFSGDEAMNIVLNDGTVLATNDSLYTVIQRVTKK